MGFIMFKFKQRLWVYSPIMWGVITFVGGILFWHIAGIIVFSMLSHQSSSGTVWFLIFYGIVISILFLVLICFYLPKLILKRRRAKIDAISNEDEKSNELVKFYFTYERRQKQNAAIKSIKNILSGGNNNGGKIVGGAAKGIFGTAGAIVGMTGLPGGGIAKSVLGGMGNLANKGVQTATVNVNSAMNAANAALNNSKIDFLSDYKVVNRGVSDEELDEVLKKRMVKLDLLQNGLKSLQIDETQTSELPPVCIENYNMDENNENLLVAKGNDDIIRTSCYQADCLYFTTEQLCIYQYIFDISNGINFQGEKTNNFFWQDITKFSSETGGKIPNGQKSIVIKTSGGEYQCIYRETPETERTVKGMISYYEENKKKH